MDAIQLMSLSLLIAGGHVGLPVLILTFLLSSAPNKRSPTLINFLLSVVAYATSLLLLFYAGEYSSPYPAFVLCRVQSAIMHASGPLISMAGVSLVSETLTRISISSKAQPRPYWKMALLLATPWVLFLGFFLGFLFVGLQISPTSELSSIRPPFFYCRFPSGVLLSLSFLVTIIALTFILVVEVIILVKVTRYIRRFRTESRKGSVPFIHLVLRGFIFTIYVFVTLCVVLYLNATSASDTIYLALSFAPLVTFLIFGTQKDVMTVWFFCLVKKRQHEFYPEPATLTHSFGTSTMDTVTNHSGKCSA